MPIFRKSTPNPPVISTPQPVEPTRRRRIGETRVRPISIHVTPPQVNERDSSLYKHEDPNFPKSYPDAYVPTRPTSSQPPSLSASTSPSSSPSRSSSYRSSTSPLSRPTTWFGSDSESDHVITLPEVDQGYGNHQLQQQPFVVRSRFVEHAQLDTSAGGAEKKRKRGLGLLASFSTLDLSLGLSGDKKEKEKVEKPRFRAFGMSSEIWTKTTSTESIISPLIMSPSPSPPVVPPRSTLRPTQPNHRTKSSSPPLPTERNSSLYLLPVDAPLTPSLSSSSSSEHSHNDKDINMEPDNTYLKQKRGSGRGSVSGDPMKIRDGAMSRKASSGLYTPPTFPGAQGPRPSHFPTHVYTPQSFALYPTTPSPILHNYSSPPIPSRSVSTSSTTSNESNPELSTPTSSKSGMSNTFSRIRRISNQITHTHTISKPTPLNPSPSFSPTNSYFPTPSNHTSWSSAYNLPVTPLSKTFGYTPPTPGGLGVGPLDDTDGMVTSVEFDEEGRVKSTSVKLQGVGSPLVKGRRKPVPKMLDLEIEGEGPRVEGVVHAL